jgi:hypothetical protein
MRHGSKYCNGTSNYEWIYMEINKDEVVTILFQSYNFISISYDFFNVQN